eukprot:scaffold3243_cov106-Isochrysis_galbana.AAC.7
MREALRTRDDDALHQAELEEEQDDRHDGQAVLLEPADQTEIPALLGAWPRGAAAHPTEEAAALHLGRGGVGDGGRGAWCEVGQGDAGGCWAARVGAGLGNT